MADVQTDKGFTRIANELYEALCRVRIPRGHLQTMLALIRLTYGFNRKSDRIGSSQISKITGREPRNTRRQLADLESWGMANRGEMSPGKSTEWAPMKDFDKWVTSGPGSRGARVHGGPGVGYTGARPVGYTGAHTKDSKDSSKERGAKSKKPRPTTPQWLLEILPESVWQKVSPFSRKKYREMSAPEGNPIGAKLDESQPVEFHAYQILVRGADEDYKPRGLTRGIGKRWSTTHLVELEKIREWAKGVRGQVRRNKIEAQLEANPSQDVGDTTDDHKAELDAMLTKPINSSRRAGAAALAADHGTGGVLESAGQGIQIDDQPGKPTH